ncbi:HlyD family secretion protein [Exilibacterium tricleocarpae]|uniref:HlyD family secretion protein n=1 Tax=Exilibacterium tricleocarpae TaxID=2591008 RepID=A0A545U9W1_9GAMM|nr:HlyD family efflux transporter periplasmic adaptor subunit [Exilibacterium tricleocarpae]TQV86260.1 HlyD family secretion protein [Exilibacterium tricleocarpae]
MMLRSLLQRRLSLPVIVVTAVLVVVALLKLTPGVDHDAQNTVARTVEFIEARTLPYKSRALGYGTVTPTTVLEANTEVAGKVIFVHPQLKQGATLPQGTLVVSIDRTHYDLALAQASADLASHRASLEELAVEQGNTEVSLQISQRRLGLGEQELQRIKRLAQQGSVSQSDADREEQSLLNLRQEVQNLNSQLALFPTRRQVIEAQIARARAQVEEQQRNLARTDIALPFTARIGAVHVEAGEFVASGTALFRAADISQVEIKAQMPLLHARALVLGLAPGAAAEVRGTPPDILEHLQLDVTVRLVGAPQSAVWEGRAVRIGEALDADSRTIAIVVAVDNSYEKIVPGQRPPLLEGMYTEVELQAPAQPRQVIPRRAIHAGRVYIARADDTLEIRPIAVAFLQGELAVVEAGVEDGERVIVTDLVPAVAGVKLNPRHRPATEREIDLLAAGGGVFK